MTHIKKLVIHGFKSFAQKTEIVFDKGVNVIIGPNGSGKSNVSDALCFVLGRLSTKSIRAAKAKNLLFMGSKYVKPAHEAVVELVFDNTDRTFPIEQDEVTLTRIVRHNGISIYKLNGETKTRSDIIETLAQAGIDPHGFNLVLQGQIQSVVRMHAEERRKVIEEVAGISIYESRKEKSLHELEKTEEKLKEIIAILRERTAFLKNLENERAQALKFKELEETVRRCKASIIQKRIEDKEKELGSVQKSLDEKTAHKEKIRAKIVEFQEKIEKLNERIQQINKHIQHSTGIEQETLHTQITNFKAELEGLRVRKENFEHRRGEIERRVTEIQKSIPDYEKEIEELRKESPLVAKKQEELKKKKLELEKLEEERKRVYALRAELNGLKDRVRDKEAQLARSAGESDALLKQIEEATRTVQYKDLETCRDALEDLKKTVVEKKKKLDDLGKRELECVMLRSSAKTEMEGAQRIRTQVEKLDTCPLCQSKITVEHIHHVTDDSNKKITEAEQVLEKAAHETEQIKQERLVVHEELRVIEHKISETERELSVHRVMTEKQSYLSKLVEQEKLLEREVKEFATKRDTLQQKTLDVGSVEERYSSTLMEIEEISSRTEEDLDQTLLYKEREIEKMREVIKLGKKDRESIEHEIHEFTETITTKTAALQKKEIEEQELTEKFKKLFIERDETQAESQKLSYESSSTQTEWRQIEDQINYLKVGNAKFEAEKEALEMEMRDFVGIELIKASLAVIEERLQKAQASLHTIGSINMRALEIYDEIKTEYDRVQEKVNILQNEKEEILKIITEIDYKKKRTFMKTFNQINELFTSNFTRLSAKGQAFLEIENPEDIFAGGVFIVIRMAKGKYFDVTSLSGGEQTLVALSLLFAIQEYKPYHFYIFDEIDAALDKRNSERLSALLKQYMKSGQYITITHNDAIILDSNVLYGVSMHEGVSKVLSLKLGQDKETTDSSKPEDHDPQNSAQETKN